MKKKLLTVSEDDIGVIDEIVIPLEILKPKRKGKAAKRKEDGVDYISNKLMTECTGAWVLENKGKKSRKEWTQMPNYLGECIMKITENYGRKPNFRNYTYIDEMKSEAVLTCVKYAHNFDITKSSNAFSYFTQIVHYCMLQIIAKEKKQAALKNKVISERSIYNYNDINLHNPEEADV
jgi:hypothetical protein